MENDIWKTWGTRFKAHMKTAKVTQEDLAEKMEVTQGAIAHWLKGRRDINLADYFKLCAFAGADPQTVLFSASAITSPAVAEALKTLVAHAPELRGLLGPSPTDRTVEELLPPVPSRIPRNVKKKRRFPIAVRSRRGRVTG